MMATLTWSGSTGYSTANWKSYDVWGGERASTGSGSMFGYCGNLGHPTDPENGLIYMRARFYEPWTGRFLSEDPGKDGVNWFSYASSRPTSNIDISGLYSENLGDKLFRNAVPFVTELIATFKLLTSMVDVMKKSAAAFVIGMSMITCTIMWAADIFCEGAPLVGFLQMAFFSACAGVATAAQIDYRISGTSKSALKHTMTSAWEAYYKGILLFMCVMALEASINDTVR